MAAVLPLALTVLPRTVTSDQKGTKNMKICFALMAVWCLFGMIAEPDPNSRKNFAFSFVATVFGIVALYIIERVVPLL